MKIRLNYFSGVYTILFIFALVSLPAYAANHYVDKNAAGSNNGSSWSNAWESFGAISWSSVNAGDIIYISGGSDSTIYNETLTVGKSGTSGSRIVISHGTESGHNGKVIIDGGNTLSNGILVNGRSYVTVTGFTVRYTHDGSIEVSNSDHIIVENCDITVTGRAGVYVRQNNNIEVRGCNIATGSYVNTQTDGMYSQLNTDNVYHNNHIVVNNSEPTGHDDCIQSYQDNNLTVHSNYLEQNNSKPNNSQGIYATTPTGGVFKFYNNIVNLTQSGSNGITFRRLTGVGTVQIVGNTAYGQNSATLIQTTEVDDPVIKNNVIYSGSAAFGARVINWAGNPSNIDNNIIYVPNSANVWSFNGVSKSWSQWKALGFDVHGKNADPKFTSINNKNFSLQQTSPGVDAGLAAGSPYNVDIMGVSRPQGQNYDMGAYEYNGGNPNPDTTPPEVTGAELADSITVLVHFSEAVSQATAENESNYSISEGIGVTSALLSPDGLDVTLSTEMHLVGPVYSVTVVNVQDPAGNTISANANSAQYQLIVNPEGDLNQLNIIGAASSNWYQNYVPPLTIDGNSDPSSESRWAGSVPMPDTITFDLGELKLIKQSKFSFYKWDQSRVYHYEVLVSSDNINWFQVVSNAPSDASQWSVMSFYPIAGQYVRLISIDNNESSFAGVWEAEIWGSAAPIPVELTSFTAEQLNNSIVIKWATATETNNKGFEVQKKNNGDYTVIGFVEGHGTTSEKYDYKFNDNEVQPGESTYRIRQVDFDGAFEYSDEVTISIEKPEGFELSQNYPNPFNPTTKIQFSIPVDNHVKLTLYNLLGERVKDIIDNDYKAGTHEINLNASGLSSGVYLYKIETGNFVSIKKMMVMK